MRSLSNGLALPHSARRLACTGWQWTVAHIWARELFMSLTKWNENTWAYRLYRGKRCKTQTTGVQKMQVKPCCTRSFIKINCSPVSHLSIVHLVNWWNCIRLFCDFFDQTAGKTKDISDQPQLSLTAVSANLETEMVITVIIPAPPTSNVLTLLESLSMQ